MSTCYKFTVNNANEAATVIRERLGESARVLSVRTVEPTGLRGLFGSPKIEVIALVPETARAVASTPTTLNAASDDEASPEGWRRGALTPHSSSPGEGT